MLVAGVHISDGEHVRPAGVRVGVRRGRRRGGDARLQGQSGGAAGSDAGEARQKCAARNRFYIASGHRSPSLRAVLAALRPRVSILLKMAGSVGPGKYFLVSTKIFVDIYEHLRIHSPT